MSIGKLITQPSVAQVGAGQRYIINIPANGTYHAFYLTCTDGGAPCTDAQIANDISTIRVLINGQEFTNLTGAQFQMLAKKKGLHVADNGVIPIFFYDTRLDTYALRQVPGIGCLDVSTLQIEINTTSSLANVDAIGCVSDWSVTQEALGACLKYIAQGGIQISTGQTDRNDLNTFAAGDIIRELDLVVSSAVITDISILVNSVLATDKASPAVLNQDLTLGGGAPQTGVISLDYNTGRQALGGLTLPSGKYQLRTSATTAGTVEIISTVINNPTGQA